MLRSNEKWRRNNLHPIEYDAFVWDRKGRDNSYLLAGSELAQARYWLLRHGNDARDLERAFIETSRQRSGQTMLRNRLTLLVAGLLVVVFVELAVIIYLVVAT